jgi:hypothetical protein
MSRHRRRQGSGATPDGDRRHSQRGLLTKLMAIDSGTRFRDDVSREPFEQFQAPAETRTLLQDKVSILRAGQVLELTGKAR